MIISLSIAQKIHDQIKIDRIIDGKTNDSAICQQLNIVIMQVRSMSNSNCHKSCIAHTDAKYRRFQELLPPDFDHSLSDPCRMVNLTAAGNQSK